MLPMLIRITALASVGGLMVLFVERDYRVMRAKLGTLALLKSQCSQHEILSQMLVHLRQQRQYLVDQKLDPPQRSVLRGIAQIDRLYLQLDQRYVENEPAPLPIILRNTAPQLNNPRTKALLEQLMNCKPDPNRPRISAPTQCYTTNAPEWFRQARPPRFNPTTQALVDRLRYGC